MIIIIWSNQYKYCNFARNQNSVFYSLPLNKLFLISKVTTIPILISNNKIAIRGKCKTIKRCILSFLIEGNPALMKDWIILILDKATHFKMALVENDINIY